MKKTSFAVCAVVAAFLYLGSNSSFVKASSVNGMPADTSKKEKKVEVKPASATKADSTKKVTK